MAMIHANGVQLHHEIRGDGPPVLFIMGASGDGGHFAKVADLLSDEFTIITYDRRGNGRSPRPPNWETTSPEEQADDAAALLGALGVASAAVFGTSSDGTFALCTLVRHPRLVSGCILHEPVLARLYDDPNSARAAAELTGRAAAEGGPPLAVERFWRLVAGDDNWRNLEPDLRDRMLAKAGTLVEVELGTFEGYLPTDAELSSIAAPVRLMVSENGRTPQHQAAGRLAERLEVPVQRVPGTHTSYWDHPDEMSAAIRSFLRRLN
ncbi:MAG: alpha/beta fold hydrolase [Streptosporangiales bacterium]|nr:alpha/beta fold hydrolase [Streptosporangiales bacterium]